MSTRRKKKRLGPKDFWALWELTWERVGKKPRDRLEWAVNAVQRSPKEMTPGDWENLRLELAGFVGLGKSTRQFGYGGATGSGGEIDRPSEDEARGMLERMGRMIQSAVKREPVIIAPVKGTLKLWWDPRPNAQIWVRLWSGVHMGWTDRAAHTLGELIESHGHLLKECPALAVRGKEGETCGTWFVGSRAGQAYCSARCQSRASTRAAREGTLTPATQRQREALQTGKEG